MSQFQEKEADRVHRGIKRKFCNDQAVTGKCTSQSVMDTTNKKSQDCQIDFKRKKETDETRIFRFKRKETDKISIEKAEVFASVEVNDSKFSKDKTLVDNVCPTYSIGQNVLDFNHENKSDVFVNAVKSDLGDIESAVSKTLQDAYSAGETCKEGNNNKVFDSSFININTLNNLNPVPECKQSVLQQQEIKEVSVCSNSQNRQKPFTDSVETLLLETKDSKASDMKENLLIYGQSEETPSESEQLELVKLKDMDAEQLYKLDNDSRKDSTVIKGAIPADHSTRVTGNGTQKSGNKTKEVLDDFKSGSSNSVKHNSFIKRDPEDCHYTEVDKETINAKNETDTILFNAEKENFVEHKTGDTSGVVNTITNEADLLQSDSKENLSSTTVTIEEIYLQSTDPVNVENALGYKQHENINLGQVLPVLEVDFEAISTNNTPLSVDVAQEGKSN